MCVEWMGNAALGFSMAEVADGCEGFSGTGMLRPWYVAECLCRLLFRGCFWNGLIVADAGISVWRVQMWHLVLWCCFPCAFIM